MYKKIDYVINFKRSLSHDLANACIGKTQSVDTESRSKRILYTRDKIAKDIQ